MKDDETVIYEDHVLTITEHHIIRNSSGGAVPLSAVTRVYRAVKTKSSSQVVPSYGIDNNGKWVDGYGYATVDEFAGFELRVMTGDKMYTYDYGEDSADTTSGAISALKQLCPEATFGAPPPSLFEEVLNLLLALFGIGMMAFVGWIILMGLGVL